MEPIGGLLHRRPSETAAFSAAFVVGVMNRILQEEIQLGERDARAISFNNGKIVIGVSHGTVAGRIQQQAERIIEASNAALKKLGAPKMHQIRTIQTRLSSSL